MKENSRGANNLLGAKSQDVVPLNVSRRRKLNSRVAVAVAGFAMLTAFDAEAVDGASETKKKTKKITNSKSVGSVSELQAQVDRLNRELAASKQRELDLIRHGVSSAPVGTTETAATSAGIAGGGVGIGGAEPATEQMTAENDIQKEDLGEVVVRAKPRIQKLHDVPNSSSVRTGEELHRELAYDLESILARSGNVKWNNGNSRTSSLGMRGIGMQAQTDAMDPSVGTVVDGVPYAYSPLTSFDQFDVDQVEVDRGPQGTAGGKNFSVGQINITNKRPTFTREATYSAAYGSYNTYLADAAAGGSVVDNLLAYRGAIHINKADGATSNLYNPTETWYNRDRVAGRLQFLLTPTEDFSARAEFDIQPQTKEYFNGNSFFTPTPHYYSNGVVNPLSTDASTRLNRSWFVNENPSYSYAGSYLYGGGVGKFNQDSQYPLVSESKGGLAELNWNVNGYKLSSITSARDYGFLANNDEGTPFDISKNGGGAVPDFIQLSEELKVSSNIGNLVEYTSGLYLLERKMTKGNSVGFGSDAGAWFASNSQYKILDPTNYSLTTGGTTYTSNGTSGQSLMRDSLNNLETNSPYFIDNKTGALFTNAKWHITEPLTLTTGIRMSAENRSQGTNKVITNEGAGALLNPVSVNGINTGGFNSDASGNLLAGNSSQQVAEANQVAQQYFGVSSYTSLNPAQLKQVATAKALRASNMGSLWSNEPGLTYKGVQPGYVVSPSYKFNDDITSYISWQYQEKAGLSQTVNGVAYAVLPEKTNSYEIGFKTLWLDKSLTFNTDFYWTDITNYQQQVEVVDAYTTALNQLPGGSGARAYTAITGNAPGVRSIGVEIDGAYSGIPNTQINYSGAWNNAIYTSFTNSAMPADLAISGGPAFRDVTGMTLPGAARFTFNISPEFRYPVDWLGANEFHTSFTERFSSAYNSDVTLSQYGNIPANVYTDISIGFGRRDKGFDFSVVGKNIFENNTPYSITWNSWTPGLPRWIGVMVSGKF